MIGTGAIVLSLIRTPMTTQQPQVVTTRASRQWLGWFKSLLPLGTAIVAFAGVAVLLAALGGVFHSKVSNVPAASNDEQIGETSVAEIVAVTRPRYETAVGTVKPVHESTIASKLLARVVEVNVKAGQAISAGDVLVRLEDADLQARLKQAEAAVLGARASKQRADSDYERAKPLVQTRTIPQAELDQIVAAQKLAESALESSQEALSESRTVLDYATIRAPFSGIVIDKRVEAGDTATPGQALLSIYDPTRMQLVASVRESLALRLTVGQKLPARLDALDHECLATVSEIVPESESASRSFLVKVTGPCPPGVYSGMFGRLLLPLDDEQLIVVPARAVRHVGQLTMVDVVDGANMHRRYVQLGRQIDGNYEVLSGLKVGEKVATRNRQA